MNVRLIIYLPRLHKLVISLLMSLSSTIMPHVIQKQKQTQETLALRGHITMVAKLQEHHIQSLSAQYEQRALCSLCNSTPPGRKQSKRGFSRLLIVYACTERFKWREIRSFHLNCKAHSFTIIFKRVLVLQMCTYIHRNVHQIILPSNFVSVPLDVHRCFCTLPLSKYGHCGQGWNQ